MVKIAVDSEQLLVATKRTKPNTDSLNLKAVGVDVGKQKEILKQVMKSFIQNGDVVYKAAFEGLKCA